MIDSYINNIARDNVVYRGCTGSEDGARGMWPARRNPRRVFICNSLCGVASMLVKATGGMVGKA